MNQRLLLASSLPFLVVACGGTLAPSPEQAQASGPVDLVSACLAPAPSAAPTSVGDTTKLRSMSGRWLLNGPVIGETQLVTPSAVGIEINEDGRFRELRRDGAGRLIRAQGFTAEGRIALDDTIADPTGQGRIVGNILRPGNGFLPFYASVDPAARTLGLDAYQANGTFVATDEAPTNPCPAQPGARLGAAACGLGEASIHFDLGAAEIAARLVGRWSTCSVERGYGTPPAGYEFTADGHWYELATSSSGDLVRGARSGTIDYVANGGSAQVNLNGDGGTEVVFVSFSDAPMKLRIDVGTAATTIVLAAMP